MQAKIFCKTVAKGRQSFYVMVNEKAYFLFQQDYRSSNKKYFQNGICVAEMNKYAGVHSTSVRKTLEKLPSFIRYIEKEYDVAILNKTKEISQKKKKGYKRQPFLWQQVDWQAA